MEFNDLRVEMIVKCTCVYFPEEVEWEIISIHKGEVVQLSCITEGLYYGSFVTINFSELIFD